MSLKQCDDKSLLELLDQSNDSEAPREMLDHLDSCERCQERIVALAADGDSWSEATHALRDSDAFQRGEDSTCQLAPFRSDGSVIIAIDAELSPDMPLQADQVCLDFLDPPSHPEMLGRVGEFDVERLIGTGGMGIVFKAFDSELHRPVAVKILAPHLAHSGGARQRFAREAQSAAAVIHENVVPIHFVDSHDELPYLVMQYVSGESLQARVDREGPLSTNEVLQIGIQIASGLAAAHEQGLVHRDVKPGNILLEPGVSRVLISDFGLARAADDASVTRSGIIAGTPHYMSPEQARGQAIDVRSDLFGLGGVLYFMCTGRPAFRADGAMAVLNRICSTEHRPVDEVNEQVPAALADLIDQLLSKKPSDRQESSELVSTQLSQQMKQSRSGRPKFRKQQKSLRRRIKWVAGAAVTLLTLTIVWSVTQYPFRVIRSNRRVRSQPESGSLLPSDGYMPPAASPQVFGNTGQFNPSPIPPNRQSSVSAWESPTMVQPLPAPATPMSNLDAEIDRQLRELKQGIEDFESNVKIAPMLVPSWQPDPTAQQINEIDQIIKELESPTR